MFLSDSTYYDVAKVARYQSDKAYDYAAQTPESDFSLTEMLSRWLNRLFDKLFSGAVEENFTSPVMITLFAVALAAAFFYLVKKKPNLFRRTRKTGKLPYSVEEENIHAIQFDSEIEKAVTQRDYRLAIRLKYLETLRFLSDNNLIDWQIHKTPTEYVYELRKSELRPLLKSLTVRFIEVRYGNYAATPDLYGEVCHYHRQLRKGGATTA